MLTVTGQVFGSSTQGYGCVEYLESNLGPLADRFECDSTVDLFTL